MTSGIGPAVLLLACLAGTGGPLPTTPAAPGRTSCGFNILDFGATADDELDDTAAIQAALDAAAARGGGVVLVPAGTFLVTPAGERAWLRMGSGTTLRGVGPASVLMVRDGVGDYSRVIGQAGASTLVSNIVIRDLRINQNASHNRAASVQVDHPGTAQNVLLFTAFDSLAVENLIIDEASGVNTIQLNGPVSSSAVVRGCRIRFLGSSASPTYDNSAIYVHGTRFRIEGNVLESQAPLGRAVTGIEAHGGPGVIAGNQTYEYASGVHVVSRGLNEDDSSPTNVSVVGNVISKAANGINLWSLTGRSLRNVAVTANVIGISNAAHKANAHAGIRLWNDAVSGQVSGSFEGITITSNAIQLEREERAGYALSESGGLILAAQGSISDLVVSNNVVRDSPNQGIRLQSYRGQVSTASLTDNVIAGSGNNSLGGGYRIGVGLFGTVRASRVAGNLVTYAAADSGVVAWHLAGLSNDSDVEFRSNTVRPGGAAARSFFSPAVHAKRQATVAASAATQLDASAAEHFVVVATTSQPVNLAPPINGVVGQRITLQVKNMGRELLAPIRFAPEFRTVGALAAPAPGCSRMLEVEFDGVRWWEISRSAADIPND